MTTSELQKRLLLLAGSLGLALGMGACVDIEESDADDGPDAEYRVETDDREIEVDVDR